MLKKKTLAADKLVEHVLDKNLDHKRARIKNILESQIDIIIELRDSYDPTTAEWRFLEYDKDYLTTDIEGISEEELSN